MASRRASAISNETLRHRKFSSDRELRQAELSARLEEGWSAISHTPQIQEHPNENETEKLQFQSIKVPFRKESLVSPFEFHPGRRLSRLNSFPFAASAGINTDFTFGDAAPWREPNDAQVEDIERRAAVVHRAETASLDLTRAREHIYPEQPQIRASSWATKWHNWRSSEKKNIKQSLAHGLHIVASMHAALGLGFVAHRSPDWVKRQQLHVFEYTTSLTKTFSCDSHVALPDTEAFRHHLTNLSGPMPRFAEGNAVRIVQIRNKPEALKYMDEAFAISNTDIYHRDRTFHEWMQEERDPRRTSNMTMRVRTCFDTKRQVIRMAIGIDLGFAEFVFEEGYPGSTNLSQQDLAQSQQQRIAIYMQRSPSHATPDPKVMQFNSRAQDGPEFTKQDNIVICEYSSEAWSEISNTPTLLALSPVTGLRQTGSAGMMASAVSHIFWELVAKWEAQIAAIHQPFADLEDLIYRQPSNITHANQVWEWSRFLQNRLKLSLRHLKAIQMFQDDFELFAETEGVEWLNNTLLEMKHIADMIRGDYIEPLEHMIDLMYKSVTIRDSRLSLELGTSLWRLSWITFIFLPLTFLVGFFGMNVDTFTDSPSIKWYFVALVPLILVVTAFWAVFNRFGFEVRGHAAKHKLFFDR